MQSFDVLIVGAGVVGLATALQLQQGRPDLQIALVEKEEGPARHQSARNSGVIHSGIYYRPGSLRARNCFAGYRLLLDFCDRHDIPYELCGKVVVATTPEEAKVLPGILERGRANGLEGIRLLGREETLEKEPHLRVHQSIWVPQTGIIDYGMVARKYLELVQEAGGQAFFGCPVVDIERSGGKTIVRFGMEEARCRLLINCAGLYADKLASLSGTEHSLQVIPFRGEYYDLLPEREYLVNNLIYPVPNPNFPFLGVHFTRMIRGGIEAGPNAVLAFSREGYSRWDVRWNELLETLAFPGFRKLALQYWAEGLDELYRSFSKQAFVKALQQLLPEIREADLKRGRSGVRAMAVDQSGEMLDDFAVFERPGLINVINAPSPAATASLAIGASLAGRAIAQLDG